MKPQYIGLITGCLMIIGLAFAYYIFHVPAQSKFQFAAYTIYTAGIVWGLLSFHKRNTTNKKFKDYFSEGFKVFIVVVLLMVIYTFVFIKMNPQIINGFIEENNKLLAAKGDRTPSEIFENASKIRSMFLLTMVMGATVTYLIIGALVSLIGAGFLAQQKTLPNEIERPMQ